MIETSLLGLWVSLHLSMPSQSFKTFQSFRGHLALCGAFGLPSSSAYGFPSWLLLQSKKRSPSVPGREGETPSCRLCGRMVGAVPSNSSPLKRGR
jgi:hypothetical protein